MAIKKGICKNFGECDLADDKVVQEAESTNFVCSNPECGKPLHEINDVKKVKRVNKKLIGIIAAAVVLIGGAAAGICWKTGLFGNQTTDKDANAEQTALVETEATEPSEQKTDSIGGEEQPGITVEIDDAAGGPKKTQTTTTTQTSEPIKNPPISTTGKVNLGYGYYEGDLKNGKPDGFGEVHFTQSRKVKGDVSAEPGYKIRNARFENGRLQSGTLYDANGEKVTFIDANNNLM